MFIQLISSRINHLFRFCLCVFIFIAISACGGGGDTSPPAEDTRPPEVFSVSPADSAEGVLLDATISVSFSEAMDLASLTETSFTVSSVDGVVSGAVTVMGSLASFTPASNLAEFTTYTATISAAASDLAGNPLADSHSWTFTTKKTTTTENPNPNPQHGLETRATMGKYLNGAVSEGNMPSLLSQTGIFMDLATLTPNPALIPYKVNSPFWSDGTVKKRWLVVPNDGEPYDINEQVGFSANGSWSLPSGTVLVKHFSLVVNEMTGEQRHLETRFLAIDESGKTYGMTYQWREDQSDADALPGGTIESYSVTTATGMRTQTHTFPGEGDCKECHIPEADYVLGLNTAQLNGSYPYPNGVNDNQLRAWNHIGLLSSAFGENNIASYSRLHSLDDTSASLETRVRSYLDSNCSHCHQPDGPGKTFDGRYEIPFENQKIIWAKADNFQGLSGEAYVVHPRNLERSTLYQRANNLNESEMMPTLAKNHIDKSFVDLVAEWINAMLAVHTVAGDGNEIEVVFSQAVDATTATTATNYLVGNGITVASVVLSDDMSTAVLTTEPALEPGTEYTLTVSNVQDTAALASTIYPTKLSFKAR